MEILEKHLVVSSEVHNIIERKQAELILKGIKKTMSEITEIAIKNGINQVDDIFKI